MGQSSSDERRSSTIWLKRRTTPYASVSNGAGTEIEIAIGIVGSAHVHDSVGGGGQRQEGRERKGEKRERRKGEEKNRCFGRPTVRSILVAGASYGNTRFASAARGASAFGLLEFFVGEDEKSKRQTGCQTY